MLVDNILFQGFDRPRSFESLNAKIQKYFEIIHGMKTEHVSDHEELSLADAGITRHSLLILENGRPPRTNEVC